MVQDLKPRINMSDEENKNTSEQYGETLFKNAALTFTSESIIRDIRALIEMKAAYTSVCFKHAERVIDLLSKSSSRELRNHLTKDTIFNKMISHVYDEMKITNNVMSMLMHTLIERDNVLRESLTEEESENDG